jgi:translocation protein SEC66
MVKSALLLRAIEDVKRIWRIRDDKSALTSLHQRGLLGDDTKSRFEFAEKELEAEILDVVQEANSFKQGWGTLIFATATEMAQAERTRETVLNIPKIRMREGASILLSSLRPSSLPHLFLHLLLSPALSVLFHTGPRRIC